MIMEAYTAGNEYRANMLSEILTELKTPWTIQKNTTKPTNLFNYAPTKRQRGVPLSRHGGWE